MEETLSNSRFISFHRNQINPQPHPESTLTFAYGNSKYCKLNFLADRTWFSENGRGDEKWR